MPEPNTTPHAWRRFGPWIVPLLVLLSNLAVLFAPDLMDRCVGIWTLAGLLPGLLAARALLPDEDDLLIVAVVAAGLGYAAVIWGGLLLQYLPGAIPVWQPLVLYDILVLALWIVVRRMPSPPHRATLGRRQVALVALLLLIAVAFRLPSLGYSEFQGDETAVLTRASAGIQGMADALFLHKKGPAEILVSTVTYAASRNLNEGLARFPFAMAGLLGILGLYALGRRYFSSRAAFVAGLLIALNGFFVAFARIVQYQSLVLFFSVLGLLCALRFAESFERRYLWLCALFSATGLMAHTDAAFAAVASAIVILYALIGRHTPLMTVVRWLWVPVLAAVLAVATFYLPAMRHPYFQVATSYFQTRAGNPPENNFYHFLNIGTAYNAIYYLALLSLAMAGIGAARLSRLARPRWLLPLLFLAYMAVSLAFPTVWVRGERDYVGIFFTILIPVILFGSRESLPWRGAWAWFGLPFLAYAFWFGDPRTHLYIIFPGVALLCGAELDRLWPSLKTARWLVSGVAAAVLLVSGVYLYVAFVSHTPEYKRTYPQNRLAWFWTPFGDTFPQTGLFGYPYRAGWKVIGYLYATGVLQGDYTSNEEAVITDWYVRLPYSCDHNSRYYFTAEHVQDVHHATFDDDHFTLVGRIWVGREAKIRIYEHKPALLPYRDYHAEDPRIVSFWDQQVSRPESITVADLPSVTRLQNVQHPQQLRLGPIEYLGYDVDKAQVQPGESLRVTLYWRAATSVSTAYTQFTHVEGSGRLWAQKDQAFCCTTCKTTHWAPGDLIVDHHVMVLRADTPPGIYSLTGGMYDSNTQEPLPVLDASGNPLGNALDLGTVQVVTP